MKATKNLSKFFLVKLLLYCILCACGCACICVCVCVHAGVHTHAHTYVYPHVCMYIHSICDRILENSSKSHMKSTVFLHVFNNISTYSTAQKQRRTRCSSRARTRLEPSSLQLESCSTLGLQQ